ncbi:hypothetical protein LTR17_005779 [Elasticomyces elasticus]|nr:hypothetical protein LTR17_005779 [Elasticomyces elasticus]
MLQSHDPIQSLSTLSQHRADIVEILPIHHRDLFANTSAGACQRWEDDVPVDLWKVKRRPIRHLDEVGVDEETKLNRDGASPTLKEHLCLATRSPFDRMPVPSLPDDVFLAVVSCTDIDTFFTIRQLSRGTQALIDTHLIGVSKAVARATFPHQKRIFLQVPAPESADRCLHWLRELRYAQVAAIVLEHAIDYEALLDDQPVAAEDPLGDGLRALLTRGCKISHSLSTIVRRDPDLPSETCVSSEDDAATFERQRTLRVATCEKQLNFTDGLAYEDFRGYALLVRLLRKALLCHPVRQNDDAPIPALKSILCGAIGVKEDCKIEAEHILMNLGVTMLWAVWWAPWSFDVAKTQVRQLGLGDRKATSIRTLPLRNSNAVCRNVMGGQHEIVRVQFMRSVPSADIPGSNLPRHQKTKMFGWPDTKEVFEDRRVRTESGEPPPPFAFSDLVARSTQHLDRRQAICVSDIPRETEDESAQRTRTSLVPLHRGASVPNQRAGSQVLPEFQRMFSDWRARCKSWQTLAKEHVELYAGSP